MTNQTILTKAIEKAIAGGWKPKTPDDKTMRAPLKTIQDVIEYWDLDWKRLDWADDYYHIIFNHDFAKALWGDKNLKPTTDGNAWMAPSWQLHLQQMVIADDPIVYLGANL